MGVVVEPAELLRQHGVHVTAQRLAVLRAVSNRPHVTADDVVEAVTAEIGTISRRAVYDVVGILADKGHAPADPTGRFSRPGTRIGWVTTITTWSAAPAAAWSTSTARSVTRPCLSAADDSGYEIDEAEVIYWGQCPACQTPATR